MRKTGAGAVAVVALVVVILACVAFIIYWVTKSGAPAGPKDMSKMEVRLKCVTEGCGWTKTTTRGEAEQMPYGPAFDGVGEFHRCPDCGKCSVGEVAKCAECGKEYVNRGKGCPHCAKPEK